MNHNQTGPTSVVWIGWGTQLLSSIVMVLFISLISSVQYLAFSCSHPFCWKAFSKFLKTPVPDVCVTCAKRWDTGYICHEKSRWWYRISIAVSLLHSYPDKAVEIGQTAWPSRGQGPDKAVIERLITWTSRTGRPGQTTKRRTRGLRPWHQDSREHQEVRKRGH